MSDLKALLTSSWGAESWIRDGWDHITPEEKTSITQRMNALFSKGLPFELKHDKLVYIYLFSFLAQLEVLAIQVPLRFGSYLSDPLLQERMRTQLLDEIFHGMVFTKIVYLLCEPYAHPPALNDEIESFCQLIREETSIQVAVVLLNLITEAWIEELFQTLHDAGIAPDVFSVIMRDEHRHIQEADLYAQIGVPHAELMLPKLKLVEETLMLKLFMQYPYMQSLSTVLGNQSIVRLLHAIDQKHTFQLKKISLCPGKVWTSSINLIRNLSNISGEYVQKTPVKLTTHRKVLMTQFNPPGDPTMVGEFSINVSCLDFFNRPYPNETLSALMIQAISRGLAENPISRHFISHHNIYQSSKAYASFVVRLPGCPHHLSMILFEDAHLFSTQRLLRNMRRALKMMAYCYQLREKLEIEYPQLALMRDDVLHKMSQGFYPYPLPGTPYLCISNIGHYGFERAKSPLCKNESLRVALLKVDKKLVWNQEKSEFEAQDRLPMSVSADHRVYDGNVFAPELLETYFNQAYEQMIEGRGKEEKEDISRFEFSAMMNNLVHSRVDMAYRMVLILQTVWPDFLNLKKLFSDEGMQALFEQFELADEV
ncbi:MAG: 2-oxo acid dehydrogenase subunit E2 [Legionellaceae bacterium]